MTNGVERQDLASDSALQDYVKDGDFLDCFAVTSDMPARQAAEIITTFPRWARGLVSLRNLIVRPFGLETEGPKHKDVIGIFPVVHETDHEIIAGFNDRHLDFRVSVLSRNGRVSLATWVHRNNIGGRLYLMLILPFHILIARNALARVSQTDPRHAPSNA
ncbi:DUF2867 domain-containing protein [Falsiphaeobacter marinintestinus]|uniref:DUF2867 domain-containing protein n=1 Tax=Falsiphaeobacter marinintestinus TaxID=1492905 RepID=UPI0011B6AB51|nr:DUF2867 domain-containing protein [Phaeobacter marinintestinus]